MFDTGPQFVFNLGGGPGIRVHQFGGGRPRRRPREAGAADTPEQTLRSTIAGLLPILILFIVPLLSSLFSGGESVPAGPQFRFTKADPPYTLHRESKNLHVDYFVNPLEVADFTNKKFSQLDQRAEQTYTKALRIECEHEVDRRQRVVNEAQGWLFQDPDKMKQARGMEMKACRKLEAMGQVPKGSF
jgi:DnaJ family protein B protein 12